MSPADCLQTARLCLRHVAADDLDHIYALDNDPEVMRYINGGIATPREVVERDVMPVLTRRAADAPACGFWAAEALSGEAFVGWFSLRPTDATGTVAALGYRLRRAAWGCGYATEGVRALIECGFQQPELERIVATTYEANRASIRVMEKVGMRFAHSVRMSAADIAAADTYHSDSVEVWDGCDLEYALTRSQWLSRRYDQTKTSSSSGE